MKLIEWIKMILTLSFFAYMFYVIAVLQCMPDKNGVCT